MLKYTFVKKGTVCIPAGALSKMIGIGQKVNTCRALLTFTIMGRKKVKVIGDITEEGIEFFPRWKRGAKRGAIKIKYLLIEFKRLRRMESIWTPKGVLKF